MKSQAKERNLVWLLFGVVGGLCIAYFWPHEPAYAMATDRDQRFAICTVSVGPANPDAVFVLDFLTGRLTGALLNMQSGTFTNFWYANVTKDFEITAKGDKAKFVMIPGQGFLNANAGGAGETMALGLLYVAELSTGKVGCYSFTFRNAMQASPPQQLEPVNYFLFKEAQGK